MADSKITGLTALTGANLATGDQFGMVDVSDTTMDPSGTNKKMSAAEVAAGLFVVGGLAVPQIVAKSADETVTSSTTLQDDDHLQWPISSSATEIWFIELFLMLVGANATSDFKAALSIPAGASYRWGRGHVGGNTGLVGFFAGDATNSPPGFGSTNIDFPTINGTLAAHISGWLFGGGTSGTVKFQWAENTSDAGGTTLKKGSFLRVTKLIA